MAKCSTDLAPGIFKLVCHNYKRVLISLPDLLRLVYHNGCLESSYWDFIANGGIDLIPASQSSHANYCSGLFRYRCFYNLLGVSILCMVYIVYSETLQQGPPLLQSVSGHYWGVATPEGIYLVKNNRLMWLSSVHYSGGDLCSGGPLLRGFTVHSLCFNFTFNCLDHPHT